MYFCVVVFIVLDPCVLVFERASMVEGCWRSHILSPGPHLI